MSRLWLISKCGLSRDPLLGISPGHVLLLILFCVSCFVSWACFSIFLIFHSGFSFYDLKNMLNKWLAVSQIALRALAQMGHVSWLISKSGLSRGPGLATNP